MMRIAVTGKHGQVVQAIIERAKPLGIEIVSLGRPELDLAAAETIAPALAAAKPDIIVSAAAYTAVDKAESESESAFTINAVGAGAVAEAAAALNVPIVHISTDYVFAGDKTAAYIETDATAPVSVYGRSKLEGERRVAAATPNHVILRTAWVYSPFGANFLKTMLRLAETRSELGVVADQFGRPTSALDIADAVLAIAKRLTSDPDPALRGIFHLSAAGEASWAEFAKEIFANLAKATGKVMTVKSIGTSDYPTPAKRPANSRLDTQKLNTAYGITLPDWRHSTAIVVDRLLSEGKTP